MVVGIKEPRIMRLRGRMKVAMEGREDLAAQDRYVAPLAEQFKSDFDGEALEFLPAPDLEAIGRQLIDACEELEHLNPDMVTYLWRKKGGTSRGQSTLGKCVKTSGLVAYLSEVTWLIWLAADHINAYGFTRLQIEAMVHHELLHAGEEMDEEGNKTPSVAGHDFEGFLANIRRYGAWRENLKACKTVWGQLPLFDLDTARSGAAKARLIYDGRAVDVATGEIEEVREAN